MNAETWFEFRTDRYTKATRLVKYLKQQFGDYGYQISLQEDEIRALSARYSAESSPSSVKSITTSNNVYRAQNIIGLVASPGQTTEKTTGTSSQITPSVTV
ncbi:hypothetical protein Daesc_007837 [Daldinia eschscholtzii]|uniref:Uncharacterized protein n=1 Tax=Daldinia eschscholtzii TaxID=292717 RepID=A0AAX6MFS7_9PEZI